LAVLVAGEVQAAVAAGLVDLEQAQV